MIPNQEVLKKRASDVRYSIGHPNLNQFRRRRFFTCELRDFSKLPTPGNSHCGPETPKGFDRRRLYEEQNDNEAFLLEQDPDSDPVPLVF